VWVGGSGGPAQVSESRPFDRLRAGSGAPRFVPLVAVGLRSPGFVPLVATRPSVPGFVARLTAGFELPEFVVGSSSLSSDQRPAELRVGRLLGVSVVLDLRRESIQARS